MMRPMQGACTHSRLKLTLNPLILKERANLKEERDLASKAAARAEEDIALHRRRIAELEGRLQVVRICFTCWFYFLAVKPMLYRLPPVC